MGINTDVSCSSYLLCAQGYKEVYAGCRTYCINFADLVLHVVQVFVLLDSQNFWRKEKESCHINIFPENKQTNRGAKISIVALLS